MRVAVQQSLVVFVFYRRVSTRKRESMMDRWRSSSGDGLVTIRIDDDDLVGVAGARAVVDCRDALLVDGQAYLIRAEGRGWLRRYRAANDAFVADRPDRAEFGADCDVIGRVVCVVRDV